MQIQSMLLTQHGTATNFYGDACLCAWHPYERHHILSLDCQSTLLLHDTPRGRRDKSKSCYSGKLPFTRPPTISFVDRVLLDGVAAIGMMRMSTVEQQLIY
jgi:hypothetical protein